jgi:aldehyde dehydrogenase (NAD+)
MQHTPQISQLLKSLEISEINHGAAIGNQWIKTSGERINSVSPVDGKIIAQVNMVSEAEYNQVIAGSQEAFQSWRTIPAPRRGEIVRQLGLELRNHKDDLGALVSYEMGKSLQEGLGEVQEMIDICDFAVGLSRQLYGQTMHSERALHRMYEQWHPLGIVGIISAFNFPVAVWAWNATLAWVCGDVCIWKPSEKTPLTAIACQKIAEKIFAANDIHPGVSCLIIGKAVGEAVGKRLGKSILELGGNNAIIISQNADLEIAIPGAVFGAVGTAGQRCTSTRRLIIHESLFDEMKSRLTKAYGQLRIGNPLDQNNHVGPLIDKLAVDMYEAAITKVKLEGGKEVIAGGILEGPAYVSGCYVKPAVYEVSNDFEIVQSETFAPILYLIKYNTLDEAIAIQNNVPQGLSSSIMTTNMREAELFLSQIGSDCGIANVKRKQGEEENQVLTHGKLT